MSVEYQENFLFDENAFETSEAADPLSDFFAEVSQAWNLPIGQRVNLRLRDAALPQLSGKLKLARAPDLPLDPRQPLSLTLSGVEFTHREVASWSLC